MNSPPRLCPDRQQLLDYLNSRGGEPLRTRIEQHIQGCLNCQSQLESLKTARDGNASEGTPRQQEGVVAGGEPTMQPRSFRATAEGRYQILRLHACGGLGQVFVAADRELNREVALKQIRADRSRDEQDNQRFLLEGEITGRLEHPGIVPVYSLGGLQDGNLYYVMRLIRGESLQDRATRLHEPEPGDGKSSRRQRNLKFQQLLRQFISVVRTMDYAHQRGVIHRDLKPSNILLGKYGETLVVDWGLAKTITPDQAATLDGEPVIQPTLGQTHLAETVMGQACGTSAYMSPEQAEGKVDSLGPATDVYSLGATLHFLLTGRPPFVGDGADIPRHVREGRFARPREGDARVPRALEQICLKAMRREPHQRYATAADLAEDLEAFLADEAVQAWSEPVTARLARWGRHHLTSVAVAATILLLACLTSAGGMVFTSIKNRQIAHALREKSENFLLARRAVDALTDVAENDLDDKGGLQPVQQKLLQQALRYYQEFAARGQHDADIRSSLAGSLDRVGRLQSRIGSKEEAIEAFQRAIAIHRQQPFSESQQRALAESYLRLGAGLAELNRFAEASTALQTSEEIRGQLVEQHPDDFQTRIDWARTISWRAHGLWIEDPPQAISILHRALDIGQQATPRDDQQRREQQMFLAGIRLNLGSLLRDFVRQDEAVQQLKLARSVFQTLHDEHPEQLEYASQLAKVWGSLAVAYTESDQAEMGRQSLEEARRIFDQLRVQNPTVPDYRLSWAQILQAIGSHHARRAMTTEALDAFQQAALVYQQLRSEQPALGDATIGLAGVLFNSALNRWKQGERQAALQHLDETEQVLATQLSDNQQDQQANSILAQAYSLRAAIHEKDDLPKRIAALQQAVKLQRHVWQDTQIAAQGTALSNTMWDLFDALLLDHRIEEGFQLIAEREKLWPDVAEQQYWAAWEYAKCAHAVADHETVASRPLMGDCHGRCLTALDRAIELGFYDSDQLESNTTISSIIGEEALRQRLRRMDHEAQERG